MTAFAFTSEYINIFAVADQMEEKGNNNYIISFVVIIIFS